MAKPISALSYLMYEMSHPPVINTLLMVNKGQSSFQEFALQFSQWFDERIVQRYVEFRSIPVHKPHKCLWFLSKFEWQPVHFNKTEHYKIVHLQVKDDETELKRAINTVISEPLPKKKPLWSVYILDNYSDTIVPVIVRLHHTLGDGLSLMELFLSVSDEAKEIQGNWPTLLASVPHHLIDTQYQKHKYSHILVRLLSPLVLSIYILFGFTLCLLRYMVMIMQRWDKTKLQVPYPTSSTETCNYVFNYTPQIDVEKLRAISKRRGSTITTLVLYCLAVSLSRYLEEHGEPLEKPKQTLFGLAVNSRLPKITPPNREWLVELDNLSTGGFFSFPLSSNSATPSTWNYMHRAVERIKKDFDIYVSRFVCEFVSVALPVWLGIRALEYFNKQTVAGATNVPGPMKPIHVCGGNRVEEMFFIMPNPCNMFCAFSYNGKMRISYTTVSSTVPNPEQVTQYLMEEVAKLESQ